MLKVALKHWIYEQCIDLIFDGIASNFIGFSYSKPLEIGDKYSLIVERGENNEWYHYNCVILTKDYDRILIECERLETYHNNSLEKEGIMITTCFLNHITRIVQ
jgi:hypothetical protein